MFQQLIAIIIVLAAFGLVWWGVKQIALPPMVQTVITVVAGLVALMLIYRWVVGGTLQLP